MRIVEINTTYRGSTGKIMLQIAEEARRQGNEVLTLSSPEVSFRRRGFFVTPSKYEKQKKIQGHKYFGNYIDRIVHTFLGIVFGANGLLSIFSTLKLIIRISKFNPDVIHIHNIHGFCLNFPIFFSFLKRSSAKKVWTFHDCWPFTGHCPYFDMVGCEKWKAGCNNCPQLNVYPMSLVDNSKFFWKKKKKWFTDVKDLTIVTPSVWLSSLVKQSFLSEYDVEVINNGIDKNVFLPRVSSVREKYGLKDKIVLLGVAFDWDKRKGLDVICELANSLNSDYIIVLVGTNDAVDKELPNNVISIHKTNNQEELADLYSAADLLINPTREDNYPTVNMEAISCGTPVVTFDTGGSPEIVGGKCGWVIEKDNFEDLIDKITSLSKEEIIEKQKECILQSQNFDNKIMTEKYVEIYTR